MDVPLGDQVECPICSQHFSQETIESHADACLLGLTGKPITRNKDKSPKKFFNRKNAKRGAKDETTTTNKKIKSEVDIDIKANCDDTGCSKDSFGNEQKVNDLPMEGITKDLISPKTNKSALFFNRKTSKQRKNEQKENMGKVKKKLSSAIDLTESIEDENINKSDPNVVNPAINSVLSESTDRLEGNIDNDTDMAIEKSAFNCNDDTSSSSLSQNIEKKNIDTTDYQSPSPSTKSSIDHFFTSPTTVKLDLKVKSEKEVNIPPPPSMPFLDNSPTSVQSRVEDGVGTNKSNCTPLKEKYASKVAGQNECSPPPLTIFQQELLNMSRGSDAISPSPPAISNFQVNDATFCAGKEKRGKVTSKITTEKIKENVKEVIVEQKKEREIVLGKLPLSEQMRPNSLDDYVGQVAVGTQKLLKELFYNDCIPSMILWGPPGCGKTSLAHIISQQCKSGQRYRYVSLSATMSGVSDVKEAVKIAKNEKRLRQKHTVLFIDEVHRFNKMQQDSFLPHIEDGTIVLVGATTENPSFHLNNALISRCRIVVLNSLNVDSITRILRKAVLKLGGTENTEEQNGSTAFRFILENGVINLLSEYSNGDARIALTSLDMLLQAKLPSTNQNISNNSIPTITCEEIKEELKRGHINYDRKGDEHYDVISAFQKSIRGGDQDASIYWLARMLEGGEEPLFIARRLIVIASEDVGIADPSALNLAVSCYQSCQFIGMPECSIVLAHVTTYLSNAPKNVASYKAYNKAKTFIKQYTGAQPPVPLHLRNAPTKLMKDLGYSKGYKYTPDFEGSEGKQDYLPKDIAGTMFFT